MERRLICSLIAGFLGCACHGVVSTVFVPTPDLEEDPLPQTLAPLASAGADREVLWGFPTQLDGRGSYHPQGASFAARWVQTGGPSVHLSNPQSLSPTLLVPLEENAVLVFRLWVDDGLWQTSDEVRLLIKSEARLQGPRVRAGPDRVLAPGEASEPSEEDLLTRSTNTVGNGVWEKVEPQASPEQKLEGPAHPITIFRAFAEEAGLQSAPDYLLLWPHSVAQAGDRAPTGSVEGPGIVSTGSTFSLDATNSSDVNGDAITFRWEQLRGTPVLSGSENGAQLELRAPLLPQELVFRVHTNDALLDSAPIDLSVVTVAPESSTGTPLSLFPSKDVRTHSGNQVRLDANPGDELNDLPDLLFEWQQTVGQVDFDTTEDGRLLFFSAPTAPGEIAFSVIARSESDRLESKPAVTRVEVFPDSDNLEPEVFLCTSTFTPSPGEEVVVVAQIVDPEADALSDLRWESTVSGNDDIELRNLDPSAGITQLCNSYPSSTLGDSQLETIVVDFVAPGTGTDLGITLIACDHLNACGQASLEFTLNPI